MAIIWVSVAVIASVVVLILGWKLLNWIWLTPIKIEKKLRQQGLKGNSYNLFYGDLKEMVSMIMDSKSKPIKLSGDIVRRVLPFIHKCVNTHDRTFFAWLGPTPLLHINDPELLKEMLNKYAQFQKPRGGNPLRKVLARGIISEEGEKWAKHRKIINPAFHVEKLKNMLAVFHLCCAEMIEKWEAIVSKEGQTELDVWPSLQALSADVISRVAFGSSYEEGKKIFILNNEAAELLIEISRSLYVPGARFLPTKRNKRIKAITKEMRTSVMNIIEERLKTIIEEETSANNDLLGLLLESNYNEIQKHGSKNFGLTLDEVIEECKLFYFAGQETTSNLLVWTMVLLSQHQDWQAKAREEVIEVFGSHKEDNEYGDLNHLKTVNMILHEVLRLYPPIVAMDRMVYEEMKLGDLTLPAGVMLQLPIMMLHYDHELWGDDAKEFNPERFSEGVLKATKGKTSYLPFGGGPRICIGQNFAMLEAKMVLAMILQRFSFRLSASYSHAPHTIITLQPQFGAHLILEKI